MFGAKITDQINFITRIKNQNKIIIYTIWFVI